MVVLALGASDCEALRDGWLGQPVNAVTSVAYVTACLHVLRRGGPSGPGAALGVVGVGSVLYHGPMPAGTELAHDGSIAVLLVAVAVAMWRRGLPPRPPAAAVAALVVAIAVNLLTRTGAPLCRPSSVLQGHGAWHVLTAVGAALWLAGWRAPHGEGPATSRRGGGRGDAGLT